MKIEKLIVKNVLTCSPEDELRVPARAMWEGDCGSIPVLDSWARVVGMITGHDIAQALGIDRVREQRGGGRPVADGVACARGGLPQQARAEILDRIGEVDMLGDRHAVVAD